MMMTPPMVGVPALCSWLTTPASIPSRTVSPTWRRVRYRMIRLPTRRAMSSAVPAASDARTVVNPKTPNPGGFSVSFSQSRRR
jgi:hypothetical protein